MNRITCLILLSALIVAQPSRANEQQPAQRTNNVKTTEYRSLANRTPNSNMIRRAESRLQGAVLSRMKTAAAVDQSNRKRVCSAAQVGGPSAARPMQDAKADKVELRERADQIMSRSRQIGIVDGLSFRDKTFRSKEDRVGAMDGRTSGEFARTATRNEAAQECIQASIGRLLVRRRDVRTGQSLQPSYLFQNVASLQIGDRDKTRTL